jgi:hypothetical protein
MGSRATPVLSAEARREIVAWFEANRESLPEAVRIFRLFVSFREA